MSALHLFCAFCNEPLSLNFDFWLPFHTADATPVNTPHTAYTRQLCDVTQSSGQLSISGGSMTKTGAGNSSSNYIKSQSAENRLVGKCAAIRFKFTSTAVTTCAGGFDQANNVGSAHHFQVSSAKLFAVDRFSSADINVTLNPDTWYTVFIVQRTNGAYWFYQDGSEYYLFYVSSRWNFSTLHQIVAAGGTCEIDYFRQKTLSAPFDSDWGLDSDTITDASNGEAFTHDASGWIVFYLQTKATSTAEIRFRITDSSNYLKLTIDTSNNGKLFSVVSGVETQLGSTATMGQGEEYRILLNGSSIRVFGNGSTALLISGTDSNFNNNSSGEVTTQGGGNITYVHCIPLSTTRNDVLSQFEFMTSISEPSSSDIVEQTIYASTTGSGDGSIGNPYSFSDAILNVEPGTTLILRGGTYSNKDCTFNFSGIQSHPIFIKPYAGEHVIIDSVNDFIINGSDIVFDGSNGILEIMTDSWSGDRFLTSQNYDMAILGPRTKIINCVIHDFGNVGFWSPAVNSEFSGNLVYNIGRGNGSLGHPLYTQNNTGTKTIRENLIMQTFQSTFVIHQYGSGSSTLKGYNYEKNIAIGGRWLCGSGGSTVSDLTINNNVVYPYRIEIGLFGPSDPLHNDFHITNNRLRALAVKKGDNFQITGNTVIGTNQATYEINNSTNFTINDNDHLFYGGSIPTNKWQVNGVNYSTLAALQAAGYDGTGSYTAGTPADHQTVFVNTIDNRRAAIWIENYSGGSTFSLNLSSVTGLVNNSVYRLYNAQNFTEYHEFTYNGSSVSVPMTGWTVSTPIGTSGGAMTPVSSLFPNFGAFYLMPKF